MLLALSRNVSVKYSLLFTVGILIVWIFLRRSEIPVDISKISQNPERVKVDVYYEVLCPDSRHFILNQLNKAFESIDDIMKIHLVPYGKASYRPTTEGGYEFECQHGPTECLANMVHACVIKYVPTQPALMKFIICMIKDNYDPEEAGKRCSEIMGIDYTSINTCVNSIEGQRLLAGYGKETDALSPHLSFIPTVELNGYQGDQSAILKNLIAEVCRRYSGPRPAGCIEAL